MDNIVVPCFFDSQCSTAMRPNNNSKQHSLAACEFMLLGEQQM